MTINVNVSGTWKEIADTKVNVGETWQDTKEIYVKSNGVWELAWKRYVIPAGLIIPYNGTTAPTGWTLFTSADGKFIVGAGNTYVVGATGGVTSLTTNASNNQGAHTGGSGFSTGYWGSASSKGSSEAGAHNHQLTYNYTPPYYGLRLIKSNSSSLQLPKNAIMFSGKTFGNLTRFTDGDGKLFSSRATLGAGGNNTISGFTSTSRGSHAHGDDLCTQSGSSSGYRPASAGAHSHPHDPFTITPNLYRALLSAWTKASADFNLQAGMYAFWESTSSIPSGWFLCNGSNGTLDLRNYFVQFTTETNDGTRAGDGTISVPAIALSSVTNNHNHMGTELISSSSSRHTAYNNPHGHTIAAKSQTFLPPYYGLAIIQLAA